MQGFLDKIGNLDTETTGGGQGDRICQLSFLVCNEDLEIETIHNDLCTPPPSHLL